MSNSTSPRRRVLTIVIGVAVFAAIFVGVYALLSARNAEVNGPSSSPSATAASDAIVEFTSDDLGYTVELPANATSTAENQVLSGGATAQTYVTTASTATGGTYLISTYRYGEGVEFSDDVEENIDNTIAGMLANIDGAELTKSSIIDLDGEVARAGVISVPDAGEQLFVVAFHDGDQYLLLTSGVDAADFESFVASFEFGA
jgi:hypothetical protein